MVRIQHTVTGDMWTYSLDENMQKQGRKEREKRLMQCGAVACLGACVRACVGCVTSCLSRINVHTMTVVSARAEVAGLDRLVHRSQGWVVVSFSADLLGSDRKRFKLGEMKGVHCVVIVILVQHRWWYWQARQAVGVSVIRRLSVDDGILVSSQKHGVALSTGGLRSFNSSTPIYQTGTTITKEMLKIRHWFDF